MLIVSRNKSGDYLKLPFINDANFSEQDSCIRLDSIVGNDVDVISHSFQDKVNLIYIIKDEFLKGIAKKEYLHAILYLKSGLSLRLYNLKDCTFKHEIDSLCVNTISQLNIEFNEYSSFQKMIFRHLDLQNIIVYKNEKDMEYDISKDTLSPIKFNKDNIEKEVYF